MDLTHTAEPSPAASREDAAARASHRALPGAVLGLSLLITVLVVAFAWPASRTAPRDLPLALVAPAAVASHVEHQLAQGHPGAFQVTRFDSTAEAVQAIRSREVYGALVLAPRPEVLTASAASPVVAQLLGQAATQMAGPSAAGGAVPVRDVVPLPEGDPHGAALAAGALPIVVGSILTAVVLALRFPGRGRRLGAAVAVAVLGGFGATALLQLWLGALGGALAANWAIVSLGILAIACCPLGLYQLVGRAGLTLGAALIVLLSVPLSGLTGAPELLPSGWSALGQLMPVGAVGTAIRSTAFFDGHAVIGPLVVVLCWIVAGAACIAVRRRTEPAALRAIAGEG